MNHDPRLTADFFAKLQRLLADGQFVSTYKFSVLIALARWALEHPKHDESCPISALELAPYVFDLYWPQAKPFGKVRDTAMVAEARPGYRPAASAIGDDILIQDQGKQFPRILKIIRQCQVRTTHVHGLDRVARDKALKAIASQLMKMPLPKLHTVGRVSLPFLYRIDAGEAEGSAASKKCIRFEPGAVHWLSSFATLVEDVVRAAWLRFVIRNNPQHLAAAADVESFLFPEGRASLNAWAPVLQPIQGSSCFYCSAPLRDDVEVDHFLPWARFHRDLGHNFVLAHSACNRRKSDHLASEEALSRWCARNEQHGEAMGRQFEASGLPHDLPTVRRVAWSLYSTAQGAGGLVWDVSGDLVPLTGEWRTLLSA